ncbi:MAG: PQQ-dependent sugar dehydrogenase, partial [Myxococcota bacterium]
MSTTETLVGGLAIFTAIAVTAVSWTGCSSSDDDDGDNRIAPLDNECLLIADGYGPEGTVAVDVEEVAAGLEIPWSIDWLPDGDMLVTERTGAILAISPAGESRTVARIELDAATAEGGLLGLAVHPDFADSRWFYLYYTAVVGGSVVNRVERWLLAEDGQSAAPDRMILDEIPALQFHNGGRLRFGPDGHLYIGTGDAGQPDGSQDLDYLGGKILRLADDGAIPEDNPFPDSPVWIYGVRNTQGFDWRDDGRMVMTDHGPSELPNEGGRSGHDEVNVVAPGDNLGWPDYYACEDESERVTPSLTWTSPVPPGGTAIYTGTDIPEWRGDVFIGVLGIGGAIGHLHRVRLDEGGEVELNETYFLGDERFGRIRDVVMGPDGKLYFTTSRCDGRGDCGEG